MSGTDPEQRAREAEWRAGEALVRYHLSRDAVALPFRLGENDVFRVEDPQQGSFALRLHKPGYQDAVTIASELAWLDALAAEGIPVNAPVAGTDGALLQHAGSDTEAPPCVLFGWIEEAPRPDLDESARFMLLGEILARIHRHGRDWTPPEGFRRQRWDIDGLIGERHIHGPYRSAPGIAPGDLALFDETAARVRERIAHLREERSQGWGLIHGDYGFFNAVMGTHGPVIIDFDDCGWGWPVYDVAVALWRWQEAPDFGPHRDALLKGYETVLPFSGEQFAALDHVIMAQRLGNLGWFGKHRDSPLMELLPARIADAATACRRYLARFG